MRITGLNIYPIKGCRGVSLAQVEVDRLGLVGDRRLMLIDSDNHFLSQREIPALATIEPALAHGELMLRGCSGSEFQLTIDANGPTREVSVWAKDGLLAADQGDEAARWFSAALTTPCRLVYFGPLTRNFVDPMYSPHPEAETAFTDGYPIMATLDESLTDLNQRLADPVPMARFRPSVVISGAPAWSEDAWQTIALGEVSCDVVKPCIRCVVTTTDQVTGARDSRQEPLRTLATFRNIDSTGAAFGQNLVPRGVGTLRLGDEARLM